MAKKKKTQRHLPVRNNTRVIAAEYIHEGPLPAPAEFGAYGDILPDAPERILGMAEKEQEHRHYKDNAQIEILKRQQQYDNRNSLIGLLAGIFIVIGVLFVGFYLIMIGKEVSGWASIIGAAAIIVKAIIEWKKKEAQK